MEFKNKVIVITGGAQGIGLELANTFKKQHAHVCVIDCIEGDHFVGDVGNKEHLELFAKDVIQKYGHVDVLINNAAKNGMDAANIQDKAEISQNIADMDATNFANLIGVNLDEELADMIKYQRAYEASAKVFSTANNLIDVILTMV